MQTTRVVHYNHTGAIAGAEGVLLQALYNLRGGPLHSVVLSPRGPLQAEAQRLGVETSECPALEARFTSHPVKLLRYLQSAAASIRTLRAQLRTLHPDVVHANSVRAGLVATLATAGTDLPVVWHVHDTLPQHPLSWAIRLLARSSRRTSMIAVSAATGHTFAGLLSRSALARKTEVLHNAMAVNVATTTGDKRAALRNEFGAEGRFLIGCIGQICPRKNQIGMVETFAEVLQHEPDALLLIVGTALFAQNKAYEQALRDRVQALGLSRQVLLLGKRSDVPELLETLDLLVLPSHNEPFAMILLEAAAHATPIVAFSVDGVPELLADRRTGWLIPPRDTQQMSRTIVWAARHPEQRQRLGEAAREEMRTRQTPEQFAFRLAALLASHRHTSHKALETHMSLDAETLQSRLGDAA